MDDNCIWSAYERNSIYYSKCKDLNKCPNIYDNHCYCHNNALIHPMTIAYCGFSNNIKPDINKKCYIHFRNICGCI